MDGSRCREKRKKRRTMRCLKIQQAERNEVSGTDTREKRMNAVEEIK
jgi:hypothetical protein